MSRAAVDPQMRPLTGIAVATIIGLLATAAPILISVELAWREGVASESAITLGYARDVLRRTNEMAEQMRDGITLIEKAKFPPCSAAEIDLMRQIDISSSYIQAIGRLEGNRVICNSLGKKPFDIGPPRLITSHGAAERINVKTPVAPNHPLFILSKGGIAYFLDVALAVDIPTEGPHISTAIFVPSVSGFPLIAERDEYLDPQWFRPIAEGSSTTFLSSGYAVAIVRSASTDVAVITAAPQSYVFAQVRHFALIFIPIGLACAVLLAWAITHIARVRLSLPSVLRAAARRKEFFLEYLPVIDLNSRRIIGAEALVRWRRSGGRIVPPDDFIPIAEETGIITQITARVGEMIAADLPGLLELDPDFFIALNLSAPDLRSSQTIDLFRFILAEGKAQPKNIAAEATERGFINAAEARNVLHSLRQLGIVVAIDDFGIGYSSLSLLQSLGIDILKIDKSFVDSIGTDGVTSEVVSHIIQMAHALKLSITAEGVDTEDQAEFLRQRGVHHAQGWFFSKPISAAELRQALNVQRTRIPETTS